MSIRTIFAAHLIVICFSTPNVLPLDAAEFNSIVDLMQKEKYKLAFDRIQKIKNVNPNDPEYFVLSINYYFLKSQTNYINLKSGTPTKDSVLMLTDTLTGEPVGYIDDTTVFDFDTLKLGISILKNGISLHPNRLDMRIGLITVAEHSGLYKEMASEILSILAMSNSNRNKWSWSFSRPYHNDGRELILESVQCRMPNLMRIGTVQTDSLAELIANSLIKKYPESVYGHSNLGILYLMQGNFDKGLPHLLQALEIDPRDGIVISNLGRVYLGLGKKEKAMECFNLLLKVGSPAEQEFAKDALKQIG
jgi:tetratricopeptide (TPR) repeat protein